MQLVSPSEEWKDSFIEAVREYKQDKTHRLTHERYLAVSIPELERNFTVFAARERSHAEGKNQPEGYVPESDYWLTDGTDFIGAVRIRHYLNDHLQTAGGHIGYDIRPSKRKRGYGNKILALALEKARDLGIENVLLTCDESNEGSRKIIEKNRGVLENIVDTRPGEPRKMRFWIKL